MQTVANSYKKHSNEDSLVQTATAYQSTRLTPMLSALRLRL